jgi:hypothetical protein
MTQPIAKKWGREEKRRERAAAKQERRQATSDARKRQPKPEVHECPAQDPVSR